jgi:hypothetical protein
MPTNKPLARWVQWSAGLALLAVALTAGALSLAMNIAAGLAIGAAVAIAFALSDVAKILIPVTCQAIGWNLHLKTVYAVAAIVSVICAGLYLADQFGENIAAKENAATITANTDQQIEDLRASIATARKMADDEAGRGGCGPKCQAHNDRVEKLETALSDALRQRQSVKASDVTDGKAIVLAGALGTGEAATSRGTSLTLIFAALLIGELCAHLAGAAAAMIGQAMQRREPVAKPIQTVAKSAETVAKVATKPAAVGTAAYYLARLDREYPELATKVRNGNLSVFRARVAAGLRKEPKGRKWTKIDAYIKAPANV